MAKQEKRGKDDSAAGLVAHTEPKSAAAEAYRALRTNIQFASPDKPVHMLLATSTRPDDGKSTTIANLAITFAEAGSPTVLVDGDKMPGTRWFPEARLNLAENLLRRGDRGDAFVLWDENGPLSGGQVPKQIFIVDVIPTNERGKISRRDLARQFSQRGERSPLRTLAS